MTMQINQNSTPHVVFLLVDSTDYYQPKPDLSPQVRISKNGEPFQISEHTAQSIGNGWYRLQLARTETEVPGPLIITAAAAETAEWRDVMQVLEPTAGGGGGGAAEPVALETLKNGDFAAGTRDWIFYTNGQGTWTVTDGVSEVDINRLGNNMQLYQKDIIVEPGRYRLRFDIRADRNRPVEIYLHGHVPPRQRLFADSVGCTTDWVGFSREYVVTEREANARLRFWFVPDAKRNDKVWIKQVSLAKLE